MKILILTTKPPWPAHDGGAVATSKCIEGLVAGGASVSVIAMKTQKHLSGTLPEPAVRDITEFYKEVEINTSIHPVRLIRNLLFSDKPYDLERFGSHLYAETLKETLKNERFDIIECEGLVFSLYYDLLRSLTSSVIVLRAHNLEHRIREMMAGNNANPFVKAYLTNLAKRIENCETKAARQFDAIVPISISDQEWFASQSNGKPVSLSETGTDTNDFYVRSTNNNRIGFIGALDWKPNTDGLEWFIKEAWPCVSERIPEATLHIAGKNPSRKFIRLLKHRNILYEGEVDDAGKFTASMDIMVSPLFEGSGLRIKIIEAMSQGRAVVATPVAVGSLPLTDNENILIAEDKDQFSNAIISALENDDIRFRIEESAMKLCKERFDNKVITGRLLAFYNELTNGR